MRLKTKFQDEDFELGEVVDASIMYGYEDKIEVCCTEKMKHLKYNSIKDFTDHWEDAPEEPKGYWFIDSLGEVHKHTKDSQMLDIEQTAVEDWHLNIGNYFETKEEAEKTVEKLKAWHKLMDYWETEVLGWEIRDMPTGGNWQTVNVKFNVKTRKEPMELLDTLFGGEG